MSRYIDADKLKSEFPIRRNNYDEEHGDVHFINGIESVFEYIDYMPTADVEIVRHGKWIKNNNVYYAPFGWSPEYIYICSECGREENKQEPYCNCGAKMDGGKNEKRVST